MQQLFVSKFCYKAIVCKIDLREVFDTLRDQSPYEYCYRRSCLTKVVTFRLF